MASYFVANLEDTSASPNDYAYHVAIDSSGYIYVVGRNSTYNGCIVKYDNKGVLQWQRTFSDPHSPHETTIMGVAVDNSNNIYITGYGYTNYPTTSAFIAKYNSSGVLQWQRTLTDTFSSPSDQGYAIATDTSGNVYVAGSSLNYLGYPVAFIAKYNTSGVLQWERSLTNNFTGHPVYSLAIAVDASGNVHTSGTQANNAGYTNSFVVKYNTSGILQWQRTLTSVYGAPSAYSEGLAVDISSNVYVVGTTTNSAGHAIAYLVKYNASGTLQWQNELADTNPSGPIDLAYAVTIDSSTNIYVTGLQSNSITSGRITFLAKVDSSGTLLWQNQISDTYTGSAQYTIGFGVATDLTNGVCAIGVTQNSGGYLCMFVLTAPSDGSQTGTYSTSVAGIVYSAGSLIYSAGTQTDAAGALIDSSGSLTDAAGLYVDATGTLTSSSNNYYNTPSSNFFAFM